MKEDIFFKVGYSSYVQKDKKKRWTSKVAEKIAEHKVIASILTIIVMCLSMNCWLIYRFISILENI